MPAQKPSSSTWPHGVLLDVIDQHAAAVEPAVVAEHVEDHPRALVLVLQVRRVDQDLLRRSSAARSRCSRNTVASFRVFLLRPISPMPSTLGLSRNSGIMAITSRDRRDVLGLLGVDAQPGVMLDADTSRPAWARTR